MTTFLPAFARWLHGIALSLWLGGLLAIGALVAPTAFHILRDSPLLTLPQANALAGQIVGGSLRFFTFLCYGCGAVLLLTNFLLRRQADRRRLAACAIVSALLLASALALGLWLTPIMDAARLSGDLRTFDRLHHTYELVSTRVQFPLLLLLAWLGVCRDSETHPSR